MTFLGALEMKYRSLDVSYLHKQCSALGSPPHSCGSLKHAILVPIADLHLCILGYFAYQLLKDLIRGTVLESLDERVCKSSKYCCYFGQSHLQVSNPLCKAKPCGLLTSSLQRRADLGM